MARVCFCDIIASKQLFMKSQYRYEITEDKILVIANHLWEHTFEFDFPTAPDHQFICNINGTFTEIRDTISGSYLRSKAYQAFKRIYEEDLLKQL